MVEKQGPNIGLKDDVSHSAAQKNISPVSPCLIKKAQILASSQVKTSLSDAYYLFGVKNDDQRNEGKESSQQSSEQEEEKKSEMERDATNEAFIHREKVYVRLDSRKDDRQEICKMVSVIN